METNKALKNKKLQEKYIEDLHKHKDNLRANKLYSIQRIDILIVSVSSAAIYTCLEVMKYISSSKWLNPQQIDDFNLNFKFGGLLFIFAIILNFASQWFAYWESDHNFNSTSLDIYARENDVDYDTDIKREDRLMLRHRAATTYCNYASTLLLICGLIFTLISLWTTF